jgi:SAM-dependent methyltransferase
MKIMEIPTLKASLKELILEALSLNYVSVSGNAGIQTGNHYQSVTLGEEHTDGFRSDRQPFLEQIDFEGKRVLDLGSNLGEMSRAARARGASLVDGFEYDPFFVELAYAINAFNGTTRVSFYLRDITEPGIYTESYDVVLGLSVYIYLQHVLPSLAQITTGVLVLETHKLEGNLESTYLEPLEKHFPFHMFLGASDWGSGLDTKAQRAVIAFAKSEQLLRKHIRGLEAPPAHPLCVDRRPGTQPVIGDIDVGRTPWYDEFFKAFAFDSAEQLIAEAGRMDVDVRALVAEPDFVTKGMGGWVYWLIYLIGALQRRESGVSGPGNCYYDLLAEHWTQDPGRAKDYTHATRLAELVSRRCDDFDLFLTNREAPSKVAPLGLVIPRGPAVPTPACDVKRIYEVHAEVPVETTIFDGYHRLFLARLFGHRQMRCDFVAERDAMPDPDV